MSTSAMLEDLNSIWGADIKVFTTLGSEIIIFGTIYILIRL